jgi:outer membrane protein assembly factor BamB
MSVSMTHYFGIGIKLTDKEIDDFDKYNDFEDKYPQYSRYEFMRRTTEAKSNVRLIVDGMNGLYAYLMYVIKETDGEEMWSTECTKEFPFNSIESADVISELQTVYSLLNDGKELRTSDINIISLFHCS